MYPVDELESPDDVAVSITDDEDAALAYIGGYVIRALITSKRKLERKSMVIIHALYQFLEHPDETVIYDTNEDSENQDWMGLCNRGGLYVVRTEFHNFLTSVEIVVNPTSFDKHQTNG